MWSAVWIVGLILSRSPQPPPRDRADEADTTISETVSEKRRGRPRKHIGLYSILEAHGGEAQAVALADSSGKPGFGNIDGYKASRNKPENDDEAILDCVYEVRLE